MLKVVVTYPSEAEEKQIMALMATTATRPAPAAGPAAGGHPRHACAGGPGVHRRQIADYIVRLVFTTGIRPGRWPELKPYIRFGASPRASINLSIAAKAFAFLQGRPHVTPADIKAIAPDVLRHRVLTTFEADADRVTSEQIVRRILNQVPVP